MSSKKQKGSGRAKHVFTHSGLLQQKAVGAPENEKDMLETVPIAEKTIAESASKVRLDALPITADMLKHPEKYLDEYMKEHPSKASADDMEDDDRVTVVPDRFALESGISSSALSREWDLQRYH